MIDVEGFQESKTGHIVFKFWFLRFQFFYLRCNLQLFNLGRNR